MAEETAEALLERMKTAELPWTVFGDDGKELKDWLYYEHPLIGIVELTDGTIVLFEEVVEVGELSVWRYTVLDRGFYEGHVKNITFSSGEAMRAWIDEHIVGYAEQVWTLAKDLEVIATWR